MPLDNSRETHRMGHASTKMLDRVYGGADEGELAAGLARALSPEFGRNLDRELENVDTVDAVDDVAPPVFPGILVRRDGIEPPTRGFSVPCSTD